jgi:hypothetical protein
MEFVHVTTEKAAKAILKSGFSLEFCDSQGGSQLGRGIYLSQSPDYWAQRLNLHNWIVVDVAMEKICEDINSIEGFGDWLKANGWMKDGKPTQKAEEFIAQFVVPEEAVGRLQAEWLEELGYAGLWDKAFNNLVIWDLDAIREIRKA